MNLVLISYYQIFGYVGLRLKHQQELEKLTLITQPLKTLKFFLSAVIQYLRRSTSYLLSHVRLLILFSAFVGIAGILLALNGGHRDKVHKIMYRAIVN